LGLEVRPRHRLGRPEAGGRGEHHVVRPHDVDEDVVAEYLLAVLRGEVVVVERLDGHHAPPTTAPVCHLSQLILSGDVRYSPLSTPSLMPYHSSTSGMDAPPQLP